MQLIYILESDIQKYVIPCDHECVGKCGNPTLLQVMVSKVWWTFQSSIPHEFLYKKFLKVWFSGWFFGWRYRVDFLGQYYKTLNVFEMRSLLFHLPIFSEIIISDHKRFLLTPKKYLWSDWLRGGKCQPRFALRFEYNFMVRSIHFKLQLIYCFETRVCSKRKEC